MVPFIVSIIGLTISGVLVMLIWKTGRAYLRKRFRAAAKRDAQRLEKEDTIG